MNRLEAIQLLKRKNEALQEAIAKPLRSDLPPASSSVILAQKTLAQRLDAPGETADKPVIVSNRANEFLLARQRLSAPEAYTEVMRICGLPVIEHYTPDQHEEFNRQFVLADAYKTGFRHFGLQADAVLTFMNYGQAFLPIGVGWGKTLITLEIAGIAFARGVQRILLTVPSFVLPQLWKHDIPWARRRVVLNGVPLHCLNGTGKQKLQLAKSGRIGCYILPHSALSTRDAEDLIEAINPQLIIGDEAHAFRHRHSARTKRLMKFIYGEQNAPKPVETRPKLVWASGTITSKTVMDYYHLVLGLDEFCPLPRKSTYAHEWAAVLDSDAEPNENNTGPIRPLIEWARTQRKAPDCPPNGRGFRNAYRYRLITNPCVVSSGDADVGVSLVLQHRHQEIERCTLTEGWEALKELIKQVEECWLTPGGDEIEHAFHLWKWLNELSAGFYNELYWPDVETVARRKNVANEQAVELLKRAKEHHAVMQLYNAELRAFLKNTHLRGMDTPMLVGAEFARYGNRNIKNERLYEYWMQARAMREACPLMPDRDSRVKRICGYKIQQAKQWAQENQHGIIWYYHDGIGEWLHEAIPEAIYCPAGDRFNELILTTQDKLVIASITAHGTGKNLQFHENNFVVQSPRSASTFEQMLGRTHRNGQQADELFVTLAIHRDPNGPSFDELNFAAMLNDALYIHQTTGQRQKAIVCSYDPVPRVFSHKVLEERGHGQGLENLTREQEKFMREKFDDSDYDMTKNRSA